MSTLKITDLHISDFDESVNHFNLLTDDEQVLVNGGQTLQGGWRVLPFQLPRFVMIIENGRAVCRQVPI